MQNLPAMQKTQVWSLDREDVLEKEMATHSSILEKPMTEELSELQSVPGIAEESDTTKHTHTTCKHRFSLPILKLKSWLHLQEECRQGMRLEEPPLASK